jgi:hypothetical protein
LAISVVIGVPLWYLSGNSHDPPHSDLRYAAGLASAYLAFYALVQLGGVIAPKWWQEMGRKIEERGR